MAFQMYANLEPTKAEVDQHDAFRRGFKTGLEAAASLAEEVEAMCVNLAKGNALSSMREDGEYFACAREVGALKKQILKLYKEVKT